MAIVVATDHDPEMNINVNFLHQVNGTIQQLEKILSEQRRAAEMIFEHLQDQGFEETVIDTINDLRRQANYSTPTPQPEVPPPSVIRQSSSPSLPPSENDSLSSFHTVNEAPPGSAENPLVVIDDDDTPSYRNVQDRIPTPGPRRSTRIRSTISRAFRNLKRR